jgi:hypothetical protein
MGSNFTRQELYELVWKRPLSTIAKEIGISGSALGKACRRAGITRPDQGYWAKLKAGKPTQKRPLANRFPGASDTIYIGGMQDYYRYGRTENIEEPIGPQPTFDEAIDALQARIKKIVGKVPYPTLSSGTHPIITKLLVQDEERRESTWQNPYYDAAIDKRRLRLFNAIFLHCHGIGCTPYMSLSKYDDKDRDATIRVGEQRVSLTLLASDKNKRVKNNSNRLRLSINSSRNEHDSDSWEDSDGYRIEKSLREVIEKILLAGELQHRKQVQRQYKWEVERRAELLERERQRIIEEKRLADELRIQQERERVELLLSEATALQQAVTIRDYVKTIQNKSADLNATIEAIDKWSKWALEQADRIDPLKSLSFLDYEKSNS